MNENDVFFLVNDTGILRKRKSKLGVEPKTFQYYYYRTVVRILYH